MIEHLSYSSINSYLMCGAAWKFHYIDKVPKPTAIPLFFGSVFHKAIEKYIILRATGNDCKLLDTWDNSWNAKMEQEGEKVEWGADTPEKHHDEGIRILSDPDITSRLDEIKPLRLDNGLVIEKRVELRVPGVPIPVIGYIDIITDDGVPGDFKTSSKSWSAQKSQSEMQPLFYLAALNQMRIKSDGRFRHYVFVKTKTPKLQVFEHQHNLKECFFLFKIIENVWKAIDAGVFPENPNTWKCSPKWCGYWSVCRGKYV